MDWEFTIGKYEMSIRESSGQVAKGDLENVVDPYHWNGWTENSRSENMKCRSVNLAFEWLREASKMLSIRTIGNG